MPRYITLRSRAWISADATPETFPTCTVFEADGRPQDTGLLDVMGEKLYRVASRNPIGFCGKDQKAGEG